MTSKAIILFLFAAPEADAGFLDLARLQNLEIKGFPAPPEVLSLLQRGGFDLAILLSREQAARFIHGPVHTLTLAEAERRHILAVLSDQNGNKSMTARILKVDPKTLYNKLRQYSKPDGREGAESIYFQ